MINTGPSSTQQHASETKKEAKTTDEEPEVEIITRVEVIYEDTKAMTRIDPEYKWGEIY